LIFTEHLQAGLVRGFEVADGGWRATSSEVSGVLDAWPSALPRQAWESAIAGAGTRPVGNPASLTRTLRDRLAVNRALQATGVPVLPMEAKPERFDRVIAEWGGAIAVPRMRDGGGRRYVRAAEGAPTDGSCLLQRVLRPPTGWTEATVRAVAQRSEAGTWVFSPFVSRRSRPGGSRRSPIVDLASELLPKRAVVAMERTLAGACDALGDDPLAVELGASFAIDEHYEPHLIEVDGSPRWELLALERAQPSRWNGVVRDALCRPFLRIAAVSAS